MNLADLVSKPSGGFDVVPGFADTYPNVRVGGVAQPAVWLCDYTAPGEPVIVGVIRKPDAPGQCLVLGRVGAPGAREGTVTAAPAGSDTITVTADSVDYAATFLSSYTPVVSDRVRLLWQGRDVTVLGKVGVTPGSLVNQPTTPPPPGAATSGTLSVIASDSATYSAGYGWNSYYGQNVYQGDGSTWGAPAVNNGAFFYGAGAAQLAGSTLPAGAQILFRLPARKSGGASGSTATAHLYLHSSPDRPGGDVTRVDGPFDVSVPPGWGGGFVAVPGAWFSNLVAGYGIGISGSPYMGFKGRGEDPSAGQLLLPWQR